MTFPCLIICLPEIPAVSHVYGLQMPPEALASHLHCHPCSHPNTCCVLLGTDSVGDSEHGLSFPQLQGHCVVVRPHPSLRLWGRWVCTVLRTGFNALVKPCRCWCEQGDKRLPVPARRGRDGVEEGYIFNWLQKAQEVTRWTAVPRGNSFSTF